MRGSLPTITSITLQSPAAMRRYTFRPDVDESTRDRTLLMSRADLCCLQGLPHDFRIPDQMRCVDSCPGCTGEAGDSRGRPPNIAVGNVVDSRQMLFILQRLVRPVSQACLQRRELLQRSAAQTQAAMVAPSTDEPEEMGNAIIDSGASKHFCTSGVRLTNVRPSLGSRVANATGSLDPIAEIGDLGPLSDVRKVSSFTKTLVLSLIHI